MNKSLSTFGAVWLITMRELRIKLFSKASIITTLIMAVLISGSLIAFKAFSGENDVTFGYVENEIEAGDFTGIIFNIEAQGASAVPSGYASNDALEEAVTAGEVDSGVVATATGLEVIANESADDAVLSAVTAVSQAKSLDVLAESLPGGSEDPAIKALLEPAPVQVLNPPTEVEGSAALVGFLVGFLLYLGIFGGGMSVAQGVVEEKSSRVVEILLASVRPWQLLMGKVIGIGIASLIQVAVYVGAGVITANILGMAQDLPFDIVEIGGWVILWFLIGYFVYAFIFAGLGALVSRQEDLGQAIMLPMILIVVGYVIGVSIAPNAPDSPVVAIASFVPFTSPIVMPIRSAYGVASDLEVWIAIAIGLLTIPILLALTSKIYANGVRRSGAKVKFLDALKG